jgi:hypothetical protein
MDLAAKDFFKKGKLTVFLTSAETNLIQTEREPTFKHLCSHEFGYAYWSYNYSRYRTLKKWRPAV